MIPARGPLPSRKGWRATAGGRKIEAVTGRVHRVYRVRTRPCHPVSKAVDNTEWKRCPITTRRRELDSLCHRFNREIGFDRQNAAPIPAGDARQIAAQNFVNKVTYKPKSTVDRTNTQSYFECFVLEHHRNDEYALFLVRIKAVLDLDPTERVDSHETMLEPSDSLLVSWILHLRQDADELVEDPATGIRGRKNKAGTIAKHLSYLSGTLLELLGQKRSKSPLMDTLMEKFHDEDEVTKAVAFLPEVVFPKLWEALWTMNWPLEKKVDVWSRFLAQFGTIARSSDVTGVYCPKYSDCSFPTNTDDYTDDGIPSWIELTWMDWKSRPVNKKGSPYLIRLYHNPKSLNFCPVHWLYTHWVLRKPADRDIEGAPIFTPMDSRTYQKALRQLFKGAGVECEACSSHSVRRSAAQWAGRCGANIVTIKNVGRWETLLNLLRYVSDGVQVHTMAMQDSTSGVDPIFEFYPFNVKTAVSSIESTATELCAMQAHRSLH
jgi:hypothetical protein